MMKETILPSLFLLSIISFCLNVNACLKINFIDEFNPSNNNVTPRFSQEIDRGIELALERLAQEKICVSINKIDTKGTVANVPSLIKKFRKDSPFFIGLGSSNKAISAIDSLIATDSILLTPTATSDQLHNIENILMISSTNNNMAKNLALTLIENKISQITCASSINDTYSTDYCQKFNQFFELNGGTSKNIIVRSGNLNTSEILKQVENSKYLLLPLFELDVARIIKVLSVNNVYPTYISTDSWEPTSPVISSLIKETNKNRIISARVYTNNNRARENLEFVAKFNKKYKALPTDASAFTYEAIIILSKLKNICSEKQILSNLTGCTKKLLPLKSVTGVIKELDGNSIKRNVDIEGLKTNDK